MTPVDSNLAEALVFKYLSYTVQALQSSTATTKTAIIPPIKSQQFLHETSSPQAVNTLKDYHTYTFTSAIKHTLKTILAYCNCRAI